MLNWYHSRGKTWNFVFHFYGKNTFTVRSLVHGHACMQASLYIWTKSSWRFFSQHLPFQSVNSDTRVGCERCSRLIKKKLARRKSIV